MAIFEKKIARKVLLDDTESLTCVIENYHNINGHTEYVIRVQRGPFRDKSWHIYKRYNDFLSLYSSLQSSGLSLPFPPKKLIGNMDREFISERQQALQKYLNAVLMNPILASSLTTKKFVDPDSYSTPFHELALQYVSLALRGEVGWEVVGPQPDIGWRLRKHYFQVKCKSSPKDDLLASWVDYGPDKYLEDKDMHAVFKSLGQIQHPYIHSIELCLCTEVGGLVVRKANKNGSLRDILCSAKPRQSFLKKYGNPKGHTHLSVEQIALYGKQILEALKFLHDKGLPYGHLHSGNLILENDRVRLLDIENGVLGVPSFYRPYFVQHKRIHSLQMIDVYSFGHTLYEMAFGCPLHESVCENYPTNCPPLLKSILESILSAEACKGGLPTIEALMSHPFFSSITLTHGPDEKGHLKIPCSTKEQLRLAQMQLEERLKEEQKMVRSQKRLVKVQEMMSSEEEKKKRKHKAKQEQKQQQKEQQKEQQREQKKQLLQQQQLSIQNGSERSESVNSTSTATSVGTVTPPSTTGSNIPSPPPPPPMAPLSPPPLPPPVPEMNGLSTPASASKDRTALLGSICNFNKSNLRKTALPTSV